MSARPALRAEVTAAVSAERAFEVLTDWPRHRAWMPLTRAAGGHGVGARITGWTGIGPIRFADPMVITEWVPGRRVAVRHTGRLVRGTAWFDTEPLPDDGSRIVWVEQLEPPFGMLGRLGWPLIAPVVRHLMVVALGRLARLAAG